ncbi:EscT/YscT/HrcT family type III secretion system export apparatus protein [Bordetella genomosp. 8]|uniref:EscT/YscT/HrcT family type III secretion system export apparatus protein n=1 Tax=Bordetella genomosp. 8 TaxID=1416806 RepID=A0A1W6YQ81_9BORD|nr:type III secretion system export apparatus subunit SctT [Bordetella genomosp. 8]ARP83235.1 EscT/YscT/HrcT family type III secretion system export apparatus protein [Bordetella genomosp. 8]
MKGYATYAAVYDLLLSMVLTQPRILLLCMMLPVFSKQILPGRLRGALAIALGLLVVPLVLPGTAAAAPISLFAVLMLVAKEAFIGLVLGLFLAIPFWAIEGVGSVIDYQRGASMGALLNPTVGGETTPTAVLMQLAYGVFFFVGGGISLVLSILYDSFRLWNPWQWYPAFRQDAMPLFLAQLDRLMHLVVLLSAPVVIIMLLAEMGLGLASRFTPQLQVFFLAMPIKTGLALFVLVLYVGILFGHIDKEARRADELLPLLTHIWRAP